MKHLVTTISALIFLLFAISCHKDVKPDYIIYYDYIPDTNVHSVRAYSPPSYVIPSDSTASIKIDLDGDSKNDIEFVAAHNIEHQNPHITEYYYGVWVSSIDSKLFISTRETEDGDRPVFYDSLITIQKYSLWKNFVFLSVSSPSFGVYFDFTASFIGYKIENKYGWIKISPYIGASGGGNGVVIEKYAINLTEDNLIKAGQQN